MSLENKISRSLTTVGVRYFQSLQYVVLISQHLTVFYIPGSGIVVLHVMVQSQCRVIQPRGV